jgi:hypothetical protein
VSVHVDKVDWICKDIIFNYMYANDADYMKKKKNVCTPVRRI